MTVCHFLISFLFSSVLGLTEIPHIFPLSICSGIWRIWWFSPSQWHLLYRSCVMNFAVALWYSSSQFYKCSLVWRSWRRDLLVISYFYKSKYSPFTEILYLNWLLIASVSNGFSPTTLPRVFIHNIMRNIWWCILFALVCSLVLILFHYYYCSLFSFLSLLFPIYIPKKVYSQLNQNIAKIFPCWNT